jgi:hypothetical protein
MSIFGSIMGAIFGHGSAQASAAPTDTPSAPLPQTVDVAAIVDKAAAAKGEKLAWRTSIVDLMKALGLHGPIDLPFDRRGSRRTVDGGPGPVIWRGV